jgi:2-polyprenyl-3-methyl-5-hydroxy-6-metoxy-1,4-benzoquinol methylase
MKEINNYLQQALDYENRYKNGYGLTLPDGHVIRIYHQILKYELNIQGGDLLDFGCGNGVHAKWLADNGGFVPHGCDVSLSAINSAKEFIPEYKDNFYNSEMVPDLEKLFNKKFDFVFSNQVLYYLDRDELKQLMQSFYRILKPGGLFFASMMSNENYFYNNSSSIDNSDMRRVELRGRLNDVSFINFKSKEEMLNDFKMFRKLHCGYYDSLIREDEGSTKHWWFLGIKD